MKLIDRYTQRINRVKTLPAPLQAIWDEHGLLLPHDYPFERMAERRQFTASMWKKMPCPNALKLQYWDRLVPAGKSMPLMTGTFTHNLLSLLFIGEMPADLKIIRSEISRWVHKYRKVYEILERRNALPRWKASGNKEIRGIDALYSEADVIEAMTVRWLNNPIELEPLAVGVRGRVPIPNPKTGHRDPLWDYAFEFDALGRTTNGALWVLEWKTSALTDVETYTKQISHDPQRWGYPGGAARILQMPGNPLTEIGIVYDVLAKSVEAAPNYTVCKKGPCGKARKAAGAVVGVDDCPDCAGSGIIGMSSKAIVTSTSVLEAGFQHLVNVSPKGKLAVEAGEYNELLHSVRKQEERLLFRIWSKPNREEQACFWSEAYRAAHEVQRYASAYAKGNDIWPRQRRMCRPLGSSGCDYTKICPGSSYEYFERKPGEPGEPIEYTAPIEPADLPDDRLQPALPVTPSGDPDVPF